MIRIDIIVDTTEQVEGLLPIAVLLIVQSSGLDTALHSLFHLVLADIVLKGPDIHVACGGNGAFLVGGLCLLL